MTQEASEYTSVRKGISLSQIKEMILTETVLDSIITYQFSSENDSVRESKRNYDWYDDGEVKTRFQYSWDSENNMWINSRKTDYSWGDNGVPLTFDVFLWDSENNKWGNYTHEEYTWDENEKVISYMSFRWDNELNIWFKSFKSVNTYDDEGFLIKDIWETDTEDNEWQLYAKILYTYTEEGFNDTKTMYYRDDENTIWIETLLTENTFYENGLLKESVHYNKFDKQSEENFVLPSIPTKNDDWDTSFKEFKAYDEYDNLTLRIYSDWLDGQWVNDSKSDMYYTEEQSPLYYIGFDWDQELEVWVNKWKWEYSYYENGRRETRAEFDWDIETNTWIGDRLDEYVLTEDDKYHAIISYLWDESSNDWAVDEKEYYYRTIVTSVSETDEDYIRIYPNPCKDFITIESQMQGDIEIAIISSLGQLVQKIQTTGHRTTVDLQDVRNGTYILRVKEGNQTIVRKIIKE